MELLGLFAAAVAGASMGVGGRDKQSAAPSEAWPGPSLVLDLSSAIALEASQPPGEPLDSAASTQLSPNGSVAETPGNPPEAPQDRKPGYGRAGTQWLTFGLGYAHAFGESNDFNASGAWSTFLADEFEFGVEAAAWYFNQDGQDTGGLSASMLFRWHFWHAEDFRWTFFGDVGIGLLAGFDEVPDGGTGVNFLPRVGAGFTRAFEDGDGLESRGARWMVGVRYHHISNGRIEGNERNPGRDGVMLYAGITVPF